MHLKPQTAPGLRAHLVTRPAGQAEHSRVLGAARKKRIPFPRTPARFARPFVNAKSRVLQIPPPRRRTSAARGDVGRRKGRARLLILNGPGWKNSCVCVREISYARDICVEYREPIR